MFKVRISFFIVPNLVFKFAAIVKTTTFEAGAILKLMNSFRNLFELTVIIIMQTITGMII